jgi:iron complex transport system substrate-binding protein
MICGLGLQHQLVAVSHECDYPPAVKALPKVTRALLPENADSAAIDAWVSQRTQAEFALYALDQDAWRQANPEVVVTQTLCDVCAIAHAEVREAMGGLPKPPRLIDLAPQTLSDVLRSIQLLGETLGVGDDAARYVAQLQARVDRVAELARDLAKPSPRVVILEWIDPLFSAGHWNPELVTIAGGASLLSRRGARSQRLVWEQLVQADPEVLIIAGCGLTVPRALRDLPWLESQPGWQEMNCVRRGQVYFVDGSAYMNRPGPRLIESLEIVAHALGPAVHPKPALWEHAVGCYRDLP